MTSNHLLALSYEVERTLYESSSTWEGIDAQEIPVESLYSLVRFFLTLPY